MRSKNKEGYRYVILKGNGWIAFKKRSLERTKNRYSFEEIESMYDFNEWNVYKGTFRFRRLEPHEYQKYAVLFLSKENIDDIVEWMNGVYGFRYIVKKPNKKVMEAKIIDEIK